MDFALLLLEMFNHIANVAIVLVPCTIHMITASWLFFSYRSSLTLMLLAIVLRISLCKSFFTQLTLHYGDTITESLLPLEIQFINTSHIVRLFVLINWLFTLWCIVHQDLTAVWNEFTYGDISLELLLLLEIHHITCVILIYNRSNGLCVAPNGDTSH